MLAFAVFLAGASKGDALIQRDVVADFRGPADDHAHAVIDENAAADDCAGMNFDAGQDAADMGNKAADKAEPAAPRSMGDPMQQQRVKSGITEHHLDAGPRRRVPFAHRINVFPQPVEKTHARNSCPYSSLFM